MILFVIFNVLFFLQFYANLSVGVRLVYKNDVLRYIDEAELSECDFEDCDIGNEDNVRISMLKLFY